MSISANSPCLSQNARAVVELVGPLERERLDALQRPLGDAGQGAGRRHLEDAGDAEVVEGVHAEVPADRAGDLADDPAQHVEAVVDDLAVPVGDEPGARVVHRHRAGQRAEVADRGLHVLGVERAGDAQRHQPGLLRRLVGERLRAAPCVPAATTWPGPLSLAAVRPCFSMTASTSSRSPPRTAVMPVGGHGGRLGHRLAALADQHHRLLGGDHPGAGGGGELADAVAGDRARPCRRRRSGAGRSRAPRPARSRPAAAGRSRCARISSASASVP